MFEGARRSRAAIDAAYAEQRGSGPASIGEPLPAGPVYPLRAELSAGVLSWFLYLALGGARLLVSGASGIDLVLLASVAIGTTVGGLTGIWLTWRNAVDPAAWAPLPAEAQVRPLPRSQFWIVPVMGVFLLVISPGAMLAGIGASSVFGVASGWFWFRARRLEAQYGVTLLRPRRRGLLTDRRARGYRTIYAQPAG